MGQTFTTSSPNPNGNANRNYGNTQRGTAHDITQMNVFLPDPDIWPQPEDGYPVVLWLNLQAYKTTNLNTSIGDAQVPQQALLEAGVAVAVASLPVVRDPNTTGWATSDGATVDLSTNTFGPAYRGNGVIPYFDGGPSTSTPYPGALPTNYATTYPTRPHPMIDPDWLNAWTSAEDAIRHLRRHSMQGTEQIKVNGAKVGVYGNSASAHAALWLAHGDKALVSENISYGGQEAESTRPNLLLLQNPLMSRIAYERDGTNNGPECWEMAIEGGSSTWDESATDINDVSGSPAARILLSPLYFLLQTDFSTTDAWSGMVDANKTLPIWASSNVGPSPSNGSSDVGDNPQYGSNFGFSGTATLGLENAHDIYSLYLLARVSNVTRLVSLDESFVDADAVTSHGASKQIDASIETTTALYADMVDFALSYIGPDATQDEPDADADYYCTVAEAASKIPQWPQDDWPNGVDALQELSDTDAEINMALLDQAIPAPFTTTATSGQEFIFRNWLKGLCRTGTAYRIARIMFPHVTGSGETPVWAELKAAYMAGIKKIKEGNLPDFLKDSASDLEPSTVSTLHPSTDIASEVLTSRRNNQPTFTRRRADQF